MILNLTIALAAAFAAGLVASWLRLSPIVGYIAAGIVVGPFTPGFVADRALIAALADIGVVLLMFALGVAFSLRDLARVGTLAIGGTLVQVALTIGGGWAIALALGWDSFQGFYFGAVLAASSSMVILKTLLDRGEVGAGHGRLLLSMSIVQDLIVVLLVALLPQVAEMNAAGAMPAVASTVAKKLAIAAVFIGAGMWIGLRYLPRLMDHVARLRSPELFTALTAVLALGIAGSSAALGLSAALGAFLAGLMLSETEYEKRLTVEIVPFRDLTTMLFFVFIGMMVDVHFLLEHWLDVLALAAIVLVLKTLSTLLGMLPFRVDARTAAYTSLGMVPIGELNYLLANTGMQVGAVSGATYNLVLGASLTSILLTPAAFGLAPWFARLLSAVPGLRSLFVESEVHGDAAARFGSDAVVVGYGRVGHTVAEGLEALGMSVTVVDHRLELVREASNASLRGVYGEATSAVVLKAAHADTARLVVVAVPDFAAARAVVRQVRELNPRASIVARASHSRNEQQLLDLGADKVMVPELAGARALLRASISSLSMPA